MSKNTESLIERIKQREERGLSKYGTTLDRTDMEPAEWIQHAQDEALDLAAYLEGLKEQRFPVYELIAELAEGFCKRAAECDKLSEGKFGPPYTRLQGKREAYEHCAEMLASLLGDAPEPNNAQTVTSEVREG